MQTSTYSRQWMHSQSRAHSLSVAPLMKPLRTGLSWRAPSSIIKSSRAESRSLSRTMNLPILWRMSGLWLSCRRKATAMRWLCWDSHQGATITTSLWLSWLCTLARRSKLPVATENRKLILKIKFANLTLVVYLNLYWSEMVFNLRLALSRQLYALCHGPRSQTFKKYRKASISMVQAFGAKLNVCLTARRFQPLIFPQSSFFVKLRRIEVPGKYPKTDGNSLRLLVCTLPSFKLNRCGRELA